MVKPWKELKRYGQAGEPAGSPILAMGITQVHF